MAQFSEEEVKHAILDSVGYKSLGLDGVNFGFLKDFWNDVKRYFLQFLSVFHTNGRLLKDLIVLSWF